MEGWGIPFNFVFGFFVCFFERLEGICISIFLLLLFLRDALMDVIVGLSLTLLVRVRGR